MSVVESGNHTSIHSSIQDLKRNLASVIRGKESEIDWLITAVIAGESILIQDVPGVGKTTLAKALAASLDLSFQRIQCTPDLMPADVFGVSIFNPQTSEFSFRKGPVFCNILLVDEINRASPRTQSALLEAMAERQVTVEGVAWTLDSPFIVIATQNPSGSHGTFPLPESQLDRFAMQISMDYPDRDAELNILYQQTDSNPLERLDPVLTLNQVIQLQDRLVDVKFDRSVAEYLLSIVDRTRNHDSIELGCSPRGAISFFQCCRAFAFVQGRDFVLPDDVQRLAPLALRHRIVLKHRHQRDNQFSATALVEEIVSEIDVPV